MTIKAKLTTLFAALGIMLTAVCAYEAMTASMRVREEARAQQVNTISDLLLGSAGDWAIERGTVNGVLADPAKLTSAQRTTIADARHTADADFLRAGKLIDSETGNDAARAALAKAQQSYERFVALRQRVDHVFASGVPDPAVTSAWFGAATDLIMRGQATADAAADMLTGREDIRILKGLQVKRGLWEASEFAGRERGVLNAVIAAGKPLTPELIQRLSEDHGRVVSAWASARAGSTSLTANFRDAMQAAAASYFGRFERVRERVYAAGAVAKAYPVTAADWFRQATDGIAHIIAAQKVATQDVAAIITAQSDAARLALSGAIILLVAALAVVAVSICCLLLQVTRPLSAMTEAMRRLAAHDLDTSIPSVGRRDEIGAMAAAVTVFKEGLIEADRLTAAQAEAQAVNERRQKTVAAAIAKFETGVRELLESFAAAANRLTAAATAMTDTAAQTTNRSTAVAAAANQASTSVQTVAAATEEMAASISEIGNQVDHSATIAQKANDEASRTDQTVAALVEAAQKVGAIVQLINAVAGQTNLLALNATIEAARAGEHGKGFTVVASEVKALAHQTENATREISSYIAAIQTATGQTADAIGVIRGTITEMREISTAIAAAIEEQGTATREISRNTQEAARGTEDVTAHITAVSEGAEVTSTAADQVMSAANDVDTRSQSLRHQIDDFLAEIRAA